MPIRYFEDEKCFLLQGKNATYAMKITEKREVCHLYWGARIDTPADLPTLDELARRFSVNELKIGTGDFQEYRGFGGKSTIEPALKITFPDGTRDLFLKYQSHEINGEILHITLKDPAYPVTVTAVYTLRPEYDILERYSVIKNTGTDRFLIESAFSANWHLMPRDYRLTYFTGAYGHEFQINREKLAAGKRVVESRTGLSGPYCAPFFMIDHGEATEDAGDVFFGSVIWSGNWKIVFERDHGGRTIVTGGVNDFDFGILSEPGDRYETPVFLGGYSPDGGFGEVSRTMHRYERAYIVDATERDRLLPIIYNTHNAFVNRVDESIILDEIDAAHDVGIELFVLEGGWTGTGDIDSPENGGQAHRLGFGTWEVNRARFPHGLKPISDKLHRLGMKFGLWIEPETVFRTNRIATEHPDWLIGYKNRPTEILGMNCYSLDMANDEACDYITKRLIDIVGENGVDYVKNDFNRYNYHMGYRAAAAGHEKEGWDRYVRNMWRCYSALKAAFPDLIFENSAGGGKRTDLGMMRFAGRMHRSDNQDPVDAVTMHEGMSYFILPKMEGGACFVSGAYSQMFNHRPTSIEFQGHVGMMSSLSVSMSLREISPEKTEELKRTIALAKSVRGVVQLGELYRLVSVYTHPYGVYEYVLPDASKAVVFVLGINMQFATVPDRLCPRALDPDASYRVTGYGTYYKTQFYMYEPTYHYYEEEIPERVRDYGVHTGRALMNVGLYLTLKGHASSEVLVFEKL